MSSINKEVELTEVMLKDLKNPAVRNADNEHLGQLRGRGFTIGLVDEVNGRGAKEISGFVATRHELIQLVKYWATVAIEIEYSWFCSMPKTTSSVEIRLKPFAWRRVSRIAELLGDDETRQAVKEAYDEYGKHQIFRIWNIFLNGTPEEKKELQQEFEEEEAKFYEKEAEANQKAEADPDPTEIVIRGSGTEKYSNDKLAGVASVQNGNSAKAIRENPREVQTKNAVIN